jgi:transposase
MKNTAARKRNQVPEGYLVIGIDPHKKKHAAVAITQDLTIHAKFKVDNTREGLDLILQRAKIEMDKTNCRGVMLAIETGGHYWRNVAYYLDDKGIPYRFINQYTLKRRREGKDINKRKNDYRDAEVAAQLLCNGEFIESVIPQGVYAELRTAHNNHRRLVKERTRIINLLKGLLDALFPEFVQVFKDPCGVTALSVLSTCSIPHAIAWMRKDEFIAEIEAHHHGGHLMRRKLGELHEIAGQSIGIEAGSRSLSLEVFFLVEKLVLIREQVKVIDRILEGLVDETEEGKYLLSIRGLGYISVAGLLAELGCFTSYRTARQMIKMAGSNPIESESAGKRKQKTPMSKQGRSVLRSCTWTSVIPLLRLNPDFRAWVKERRERPAHANPLSGREVIGAASNRLLRLMFALVKNKTYYQLPQLVEVRN